MRAVIDNNVVVSALLAEGVPRTVFNKLLDSGTILISVPILLELADVLGRSKFEKYITYDERMRFLVGYLKDAEMVEVIEQIDICRDPKDNMLLELAVSGYADYLITGDDDLLILQEFEGVRIATPRQFLDEAEFQ
jgi:uncharacterized protein